MKKTKKYAFGTEDPLDPFGLMKKQPQLINPQSDPNNLWQRDQTQGIQGPQADPLYAIQAQGDPSPMGKILTDKDNWNAKDLRDLELASQLGITGINKILGDRDAGQRQRSSIRDAIQKQVFGPTYNPFPQGTGSQAIMKNGGKLEGNAQGVNTLWGGKATQISDSDHSNGMIEFSGDTHKDGGIGVQFGSETAEVEKDEVGWVDDKGALNIFGKLKLPGTNKSFKSLAKEIAKAETKVDKQKTLYSQTLTNADEADPYTQSAVSTAKIGFKSLDMQSKKIAGTKQELANYQAMILGAMQEKKKMALGGEIGPEDPRTGYINANAGKRYKTQAEIDAAQAELDANFYKSNGHLNDSIKPRLGRGIGDELLPLWVPGGPSTPVKKLATTWPQDALINSENGAMWYTNNDGDVVDIDPQAYAGRQGVASKEAQAKALANRGIAKFAEGGTIEGDDKKIPFDASNEAVVQAIIDKYSGGKSPLKAKDFIAASKKHGVPLDLMLAQAAAESNFGTKGRAVKTKNIFNVGNVDSGKNENQNSWEAGLDRYAKLIKTEYSKNGEVDVQGLLSSDFTRPKKGGKYATAPNYSSVVGNILNQINPTGNYAPGVTKDGKTPRLGNIGVPSTGQPLDQGLEILPNEGYVPQSATRTPPVETAYGIAANSATPFTGEANVGFGNRKRDYMSPLNLTQITPELLSLATNRQDPVAQQTYQPELQQTFDISYQLGRNENQSSFNQVAKIAEATGNIDALSSLAAQKYKADEQYNMQEVQGNATQRMNVYNQNTNTLNDAKLKNLAALDSQSQKQAMAKANTRKENFSALTSISGKVLQNELENKTYNAYANLFQHYGFDNKGNVTFNPDEVTTRFTPGQAQQMGMISSQQGANSLLNGNYSRKMTTVKQEDGSRVTTEELGRNKAIQEKAKTYRDLYGDRMDIIAPLLLAEFPQ